MIKLYYYKNLRFDIIFINAKKIHLEKKIKLCLSELK